MPTSAWVAIVGFKQIISPRQPSRTGATAERIDRYTLAKNLEIRQAKRD